MYHLYPPPVPHELFLLYLVFPNEKGTYRYLIMCWICLRTNNVVSIYSLSSLLPCGLTCQGEQNQPVDHEDWPEDWDIEDRKEGAGEPDDDGAGC